MLAVNQSLGNIPWFKDCVNILCNIGAIWMEHNFKIQVGIQSGPAALDFGAGTGFYLRIEKTIL